ncbi:MAG: hypothetical protein AAF844_17275 [Pseudomonadota bacterium]
MSAGRLASLLAPIELGVIVAPIRRAPVFVARSAVLAAPPPAMTAATIACRAHLERSW